jgi:hypothetical protein
LLRPGHLSGGFQKRRKQLLSRQVVQTPPRFAGRPERTLLLIVCLVAVSDRRSAKRARRGERTLPKGRRAPGASTWLGLRSLDTRVGIALAFTQAGQGAPRVQRLKLSRRSPAASEGREADTAEETPARTVQDTTPMVVAAHSEAGAGDEHLGAERSEPRTDPRRAFLPESGWKPRARMSPAAAKRRTRGGGRERPRCASSHVRPTMTMPASRPAGAARPDPLWVTLRDLEPHSTGRGAPKQLRARPWRLTGGRWLSSAGP